MAQDKEITIDKPTSFIGIFNGNFGGYEISNINIPRIQRDYAQGRETDRVGRIRDKFLNALYIALVENKQLKLDFIYGNIEKGELVPLDGQQRLTTLFLLHWYIACHEDIDLAVLHGRFTYNTRFSARDFCTELLEKYRPNFSLTRLSEDIIDQPWFRKSWLNDPTISSMLVMIDAIHEKFGQTSGLWIRLTDEEFPAICFYFLPLEKMGQTDSLYIKMNSRGKPLTDFEHFKAHFERVIKGVSIELYNTLIHKIDNEWSDILWPYRGNDNIIDDEFMRYYRFVTNMIAYENTTAISTDDFEMAEHIYGRGNPNALDNLQTLFSALNCWERFNNGDGEIKKLFHRLFSGNIYEADKVKLYTDNLDLFEQCCNHFESGGHGRFPFTSSLLLYAVVVYLVHYNKIDAIEIKERIRIVRNLIWHSSDEIREKSMKELLFETKDIILNLNINVDQRGFNSNQKSEEIEKIAWRQTHPTLVDELNHLEDHSMLRGTVKIIDIHNASSFAHRSTTFRALFNLGQQYYINISRAFLTFGDYSQNTSWRFFFGGRHESSWQQLFSFSNARKGFESTKECLQELLDTLDSEKDLLIQLEDICKQFTLTADKTWRYYFVKYPKMRRGDSGVYYWPKSREAAPYRMIMMNTPSSLHGRHWWTFLYQLSVDPDLAGLLSLEEYGNPAILNNGDSLACNNSNWKITTTTGDKILVDIPQTVGIDNEDRIIQIKDYIIKHYS